MGGRPQPPFTWRTVESVFRNAITGIDTGTAPMNSGWTKVSVLAYDELVIWDSRVAHSLIKRIDNLLDHNGIANPNVLPCLQFIGKVPGRGGTRVGVDYHCLGLVVIKSGQRYLPVVP